jgi:cleavage and polyadenylation specificity factor subunit 2
MLTYTPLSGTAKSSRTSPLAYLVQVDDIKILLDCGSPAGVRNSRLPKMGERIGSLGNYTGTVIIPKCALDTWLGSNFRCVNDSYRIAPSLDLDLLPHGELPHSGLYPYAYSK